MCFFAYAVALQTIFCDGCRHKTGKQLSHRFGSSTWRKNEKKSGTNQLTNIAMEIHDFELNMMYKWWIGPETN